MSGQLGPHDRSPVGMCAIQIKTPYFSNGGLSVVDDGVPVEVFGAYLAMACVQVSLIGFPVAFRLGIVIKKLVFVSWRPQTTMVCARWRFNFSI